MMYRYRQGQKEYKNFKQTGACGLCDPQQLEVLEDTPYFFVVHNRFPYNIWEGREVIDHRMLVPKRHLSRFDEFNNEERAALFDLIAQHDNDGYNVYARAPENTERTIPAHQHTHLIKTQDKRPQVTLYIAKPHVVFKI